MKDSQRKAMWAKKRLYTGYKVRGRGATTVYNLSKPEAEEWINRSERGGTYVYKRQRKRILNPPSSKSKFERPSHRGSQ